MATQAVLPTGNLKRRSVACVLAALLCLGACDRTEKTRQVIDQRAGEAQQSLDSARKTRNPVSYDPLTVTSKVWSGGTAMRMQHGMPLPPRYEGARGITLVSADPMSLADLANAISAQTGIPIRFSALTVGAKSFAAATPSGGSSPALGAPANGSAASVSGGADPMPISYEGSLSGLLERLSAYFGVSWRYDGSSILVSRYQTRIFTIEALPGTQEINEGMQDDTTSTSSSSSGSTSSSSSNTSAASTLTQNSKFTMGFKYWDELTQVLNSLIGGQGSVVVSPSIGTVTVTATPDTMEAVSEYLGKENKRLSRQIAINVQIYSVSLGQSEDFTVAFSGFLKNLSKFSGLNYTSAAAPNITSGGSASSFGSLSIAILNGASDPTAHAGDVFNALSTIGDTSSVAQFPMTTLNNRPVSRRVGTDTTYVSAVTQSTTASSTAVTAYTATTSTIHDGFSLQLTPRLLDDGRILLQYSFSLTGTPTLKDATIDGNTFSLPTTDSRIFVQQSVLRSGSTLIIGGVDQENLAQNKQGVGSPDNFLLGGGASSNDKRYMMFMAITPQVMDVGEDRS